MQKPLIVLDKGRVGRDPQSESILLFSVINESYAAETRKNQTSQSEIPRILSNLETIPRQKEKEAQVKGLEDVTMLVGSDRGSCAKPCID